MVTIAPTSRRKRRSGSIENRVSVWRDLASYAGMLFRNTFALALAVVDLTAYALAAAKPELALPRGVYVDTLLTAFVVGSFQIYRTTRREKEQIAVRLAQAEAALRGEAVPVPLALPRLSVQLIEGGEYEYSLRTGREGPDAYITVHLRVRNIGEVDAEVIAVHASLRDNYLSEDSIAHFSMPTFSHAESGDLQYPIRLAPAEVMLLDASFLIFPRPPSPLAKFAAKLGELGDDYEEFSPGQASVEVAHVDRSIHACSTEFRVALHPLRDQFINFWRSAGARDLVRLATGRS